MTTYAPIDTAFAATTFTVNSAIDAVNLGVSGYLTKPFRMPQILSVVAKAAQQNK